MERIPVNEPNQSALFNHLSNLLDSLGYGKSLSECVTLQSLLRLAEIVANNKRLHGEEPTMVVIQPNCGESEFDELTRRSSLPECEEKQVSIETPTMRYFFGSQQNFDISLGSGKTGLMKYAHVVFDKELKKFVKHRGVGHQAANHILKQAGY